MLFMDSMPESDEGVSGNQNNQGDIHEINEDFMVGISETNRSYAH